MDGDMNDIFQKLNSVLSDKETSDNLKNILNNFSSSENNENDTTSATSSSEHSTDNKDSNRFSGSNSASPEFDINTILKLKTILDSMNSHKNDPRANLLLSLKPYLAESKKEKVDQYVKFLNLAKVIEVLNPMGGDIKKDE
ncbi:MAG: hypothetical protein IKE01_05385 [Clostridia bacterium]|nr:hypothetical protein [Clostridia bacterium]